MKESKQSKQEKYRLSDPMVKFLKLVLLERFKPEGVYKPLRFTEARPNALAARE
jgi:hypothetical protein